MNRWTIGKRIVAGFVTILVLLTGLGITSWLEVRMIDTQVSVLTEDSLPGVRYASEAVAETLRYRTINMRHILSTDPAEKAELDRATVAQAEAVLAALRNYEKTIGTAQDRELFARIDPLLATFRNVARRVRSLSTEGKTDEAAALFRSEGAVSYAAYEKAVTDCMGSTLTAATSSGEAARSTVAYVQTLTLAVVGFALLVGIAFAVVIIRSIGRVLGNVARTLGEGSNQVAAAASQVSAAGQSLAEGASEQAASLEETSSSLEEMSSMTKRNAENADKVSNLGKEARSAADSGATDMEAMSKAMDAIKQSSDDIAKIIKTIDEIAFQTNILALNAAVEAARAGEAGMGFAVVADEVRSLAQRSAQAAKETSDKIEGAISRAVQGVQISAKVSLGLQEIVGKVRQVDELASEVAAASKEQSQGIAQVNIAVSQMDKVTQGNAANAEESASAGEELNAQAETLKGAVQELLRLVGGQAADAVPPVPTAGRTPRTKSGPAPTPHRATANGNAPAAKSPVRRAVATLVPATPRNRELPLDGDFRDF